MLRFSILLLFAGGCIVSADPLEISVPNARSAVIVLLPASGAAGARVHAIELSEEDGGRISVPRVSDISELYVVPYGCSLSRLGLPSGQIELALDELRPVIPETRRPVLFGKIPDEGAINFQELAAMPGVVRELHLLTENVSEGCCPAHILDGPINVTFRACSDQYCAARVAINADTCELIIDPSPCDDIVQASFGPLTVHVETNGEVRVDPPPAPTVCEPISPRPYTSASFDCSIPRRCPIDVRLPPREPLFEVTTATVIPGVPRHEDDVLDYGAARRGYLSDLVLLENELVVASYGGELFTRAELLCSDRGPSTIFHFFSEDSLTEVATSTAPRCSTTLARDPSQNGFLSAHAVANTARGGYDFFVLRHDSRGREMNRSAPVFVATTSPLYTMRPGALIADIDAPHAVYLATSWGYLAEDDPSSQEELVIVFASPDDLRVTRTIDLRELAGGRAVNVRSFTNAGREGDVAWVEDAIDVIRWSDDPAQPAPINDDPGELAYNLASDALTVPSLDEHGGMFVVSRSDRGAQERLRPIPPFDSNAGFVSAATWPLDQRLMIAGGLAERLPQASSRDAAIALFSPAERSFVPGLQRIGWGPVRKLTPHAAGRVYGILPWTAQIVRIRPR